MMSAKPQRQPTIFLPHGGGPCFFMDWTWGPADTWNATQRFLEGLAATLPEPPKALMVVSGHWEEPVFTASAAAQPRLIFDYSGFPEHTYRLTWPAPGDPELAERVAGLLSQAGLPAGLSANRGFDHGVFVPLKVAFPEAKIPVVTLSLAASPMHLLALITPQFEAARKHSKHGIIRDAAVHGQVCDDIAAFAATLGCTDIRVFPSPIAGGDGNLEFQIGAQNS